MKAGKKETTCLPIAGKYKAFVHVPVQGKKDESQESESVIKDGKGKRSCLLDGEKISVHTKARVYCMGMEKSEGQYDPDPTEHSMEGKKIFIEDRIVRGTPTTSNLIMAI